jgi:hypothetical protein
VQPGRGCWQAYQAKMRMSATDYRRSLDFDWVLREHQFILTMRGMDLEWREDKLVEE